MYTVINEIIT